MTSSTRWSASWSAARSVSRLSPTMDLRTTSMPILFSSSVRKSELVSRRSGVRSSEPTAIISAFIRPLCNERQSAYVPIQREDGAGSGQNRAAGGLQREADESRSAEHHVRVSLRRNPHNAAAAAIRPGDIQIRVAVKSQSLRTAESPEENADVATLRDAMHAVKTGSGRSRHVEIAARMKCQVVCRDGRLHSREHKNLAARADLENRSAAVSDVKIAGLVKRNARRNPQDRK